MRTASRYLVYRATSPNRKVYVGITCNSLRRRIQHHMSEARRGGKYVFHAALRKYGADIVWDVLEEVGSYEAACEAEHRWVLLLQAHVPGKGYNGTLGGDGGQRPSEETRAKLSRAARGRKLGAEHRRRISTALTGRSVSAATRTKLAKIARSRRPSEDTRAKMRAAHLGKTHSPDSIERMKAAKANVTASTRAKLSAAGRGRAKSLATREALSRVMSCPVERDDGVLFSSLKAAAAAAGVSGTAVSAAIRRGRPCAGHLYRFA